VNGRQPIANSEEVTGEKGRPHNGGGLSSRAGRISVRSGECRVYCCIVSIGRKRFLMIMEADPGLKSLFANAKIVSVQDEDS
jgi:hypothetical protein